jgi:hypothetical protein
MVVTLDQGFESNAQRLIINQLGTTHEELWDITWFGWDTICATYSVSGRILWIVCLLIAPTRIEYKYIE